MKEDLLKNLNLSCIRRSLLLFFLISFISIFSVSAQSYDVLNYNYNGTPVYGVKIKTNLPFLSGCQMPTLKIEGYSYGSSEPISLTLVWYIYSDKFYSPGISSSGSYTPVIYLSNENGKVTIFINDRQYYQRFKISAFAQGMGETSSWFQDWSTADEPLGGTDQEIVPYKNRFAGTVVMPDGIWNTSGVGIGTTTPHEKLSVNGKIRAQEIKVETANWPDYVFNENYNPSSLSELEKYIKANKHLPEIPSAKEAEENGISLGEMNAKLLEKIEQLTMYLIEKDKELKNANNRIDTLSAKVNLLLNK